VKKAIFLTLGLILFFAAWLYVRLGSYKSVQLSEVTAGPFKMVYLKHTGAYYKISQKIDQVEKWAHTKGEKCNPSFGEYLDDPKQISEDRLQSRGGCIVSEAVKIDSAEAALGYQSMEKPARRYLKAQFDGAPSIGPMKVYPKAMAWIQEHNLTLDGPVIELYNITSPQTIRTDYLFPVK
jgi:effector-binding domain-containing protein